MSASGPEHSIDVGDRLGPYKLVELIAIGGMGRVFRGYDESLQRFVAIKVLAPELAQDPQVASRFLEEARLAATLNHPNVVHVYSAGEINGQFYFVMELVSGHHLEALLNRHRQLHVREAVEFIHQAALGLQHAHQHGLIHGDVKPANFLVSDAGEVKVTDFGLARRVRASTRTGEAQAFGTPAYLSPEVAEGQAADHRSDIYSLGATLFHLIAGRAPFVGATLEEVLRQQIQSPVPPLQQFNTKVTPPLNQIVSRMMAKSPSARFQTYGELLHAFERYLADRPVPTVQRPGPAARGGFTPPAKLPVAPATPPPPKKDSWVGVVFTLMAVIACLLILGIFFAKSNQAKPPVPTSPAPPSPRVEPVVPKPEPPPPLQETLEAEARFEFLAIKDAAAEALALNQWGPAYAVYRNWPATRFSRTEVHQEVEAEKARIQAAAREVWAEAQARIDKFLAEKDFAEATAAVNNLAKIVNGIPELDAKTAGTREAISKAATAHASQLALHEQTASKARQATLEQVRTALDSLITGFQWENGQQLLQRTLAEAPNDTELASALAEDRLKFDCLIALRTGIAARLQTSPTVSLSLATKLGEVRGQVTGMDADRITLRQSFGQAGFAETTLSWTDLLPTSAARLFATCLDGTSLTELLGYTVLLTHQALAKQARVEDARKALQAGLQRDTARTSIFESYLSRLADFETRQARLNVARQAEADAVNLWSQLQTAVAASQWDRVNAAMVLLNTDYANTEFAKTKTKDLQQIAKYMSERALGVGFNPLDISSAANANFIFTTEFSPSGGLHDAASFGTDEFFAKQDRQGMGLPNDGRVRVPDADGAFQLMLKDPLDAIAVSWMDGRFTPQVRIELPAAQKRRYAKLAVLFTATMGRGTFRLVANYEAGAPDSFRIRSPHWQDPAPREAVIAISASPTMGRTEGKLYSEIVTLDPQRRLNSLEITWTSATTENPLHCIAVFAISGWLSDTK